MARGFGWLRSRKRPVLHGFQITWSGLTLADGSGRKGATVVVWVETVTADAARSTALRHAEEGLVGLVRMPISEVPEVEALGQRPEAVDLPQSGPGLWRTGYVLFPGIDTLH